MSTPPVNDSPKDILKKKLKQKKEKRTHSSDESGFPGLGLSGDNDIFAMLNQVNQMLKQNPEMVKRVSKCVSGVFENKSLMETLVNEIKVNTDPEDIDQPDALDSISITPSDVDIL